MIEYALIAVAGALSSLHCVGMCGMLVLAYSSRGVSFTADAAYNAGRILAYAVLGAVAALVGVRLGGMFSITAWISIACGALMMIGGLAMLDVLPVPARVALARIPAIGRVQAALVRRKSVGGTMALGMLTPLLPCGMLYAMLAKAATAGSMGDGATTMAVFGLGMAPALMMLGSLSSRITPRVRLRAERLAGVVIVVLGVIMVLRGSHVPFLPAMAGSTHCENCVQ